MARSAFVVALVFIAIVGVYAADAPVSTPSSAPSPRKSDFVPVATLKASATAPAPTAGALKTDSHTTAETPKSSATTPTSKAPVAESPEEPSSPPAPASESNAPAPSAHGPVADSPSADAPLAVPAHEAQKGAASSIKISTAGVVAASGLFFFSF